MSKLVISTESTCDLAPELVKEFEISVFNMEYAVDDNIHRMGDGAYTMKGFYDCMRQGSATRTTQVNEYEATEYLEGFLKQGKDVIHLAFSSSLSGTYNNLAKAADALSKKYPERRIAVVDSLCASSGQGLYAVIVAEYAKTHAFEQTVAYAEELKHRIVHLFVVDDLKYLARGGRISKATALLGNAIHMKPLMHMNKEGQLVAFKKVLSRKKSLMALADIAASKYDHDNPSVYVAHADCLEEAEFVADRLSASMGLKPRIMDLGMVIGCHSGPGTLAIFFTASERD